ncbi:Retrovirus-related Pol polyprotein [Arachis hypogaea]|nr:Retrovirus-related Pol polyprotein [Arachis hypogaea]
MLTQQKRQLTSTDAYGSRLLFKSSHSRGSPPFQDFLAGRGRGRRRGRAAHGGRGRGTKMMCSYCEKQGHTEDVCYKKDGFFPNLKPRQKYNTITNYMFTKENGEHFSEQQSHTNCHQENSEVHSLEFTPEKRLALLDLLKEKRVQHPSQGTNQVLTNSIQTSTQVTNKL